MIKNPPANAGDVRDVGFILASGRFPRGGQVSPLQHSCLKNPYRQRSLLGGNPHSRKESDTTDTTWHTRTYFESRNRDTDIEKGQADTEWGGQHGRVHIATCRTASWRGPAD